MSRLSRRFAALGLVLLGAALAADHLAPRVLPDFAQGLLYGLAIGCLLGAVLKARTPDPCDTSTPEQRRRYLREFVPAMALYVVAIIGSVTLLQHVDAPGLRALVALLPVPPIALAMRALVRRVRDADELQRRIELEAVSVATLLVSLGYLTAGLLQKARVIDVPSAVAMIWVFPLVCLVYGFAKILVGRRYA
ncbi:MAG TPA: hypothetical protein VLM17_04125 [Xanthomonadaceae bacterium]|nr:hypothetical protein [Xanthomonadaceae bacterium]